MYKVSQNIDPNKIFIINRSEIERRMDPYFYKEEFNGIKQKLKNVCISTIKKESIKIFSGITPLSGGDAYTNKNEGIPFIRSGDFSEDNIIDFENVNYIKEDVHNKLMKGSKLRKNDLLIAIVGATIGKVGIYNYNFEANINQAICSVRFSDNIDSNFIHIFLLTSVGQKILDRLKRPVARANINLEEVGSIPIPLVAVHKQKEIVKYYNDKILEKQQKEAEAQKLLDSIDDYLLGELGIVLPNEDDLQMIVPNHHYGYALNIENPLVKNGRLFLTSVKEVSGGRFDVKNYGAKTLLLKKSIQNIDSKKFKTEPLKSFVIQSVAGDWGKEGNDTEEIENYEKCLVIRATEFDNNYNLNLENSRVKYRYIKRSKLAKIDIRENDLLIEKSGGSLDQPVGRIAIITNDILANNKVCYSNFIHKIRVNNQLLLPEYLFCYLKTIHNIKITEAMQSQTNGIRNLIMNTYLKQDIVIPINEKGRNDLKKQQEIANNIQKMRIKALQLQTEANQILEQTKQQIEQMILGS